MAASDDYTMIERVHHELNHWGFPEFPQEIMGYGPFNIDIIVHTWVVMALVLLFTVSATRNMKLERPGKLQLMVEELFQAIRNLVNENMDPKKGAGLLSILLTLFTFILFSNLWGLVPTMMAPTANLNTTLGLALLVIIGVQVMGIKYKGIGYFKHFVQPYFFFLPLVILEELSKPITLSFRLFGNIFAGETLIYVLLGLIPFTATILGGFIPSVIWYLFKIFVSFIQAFLFTMLTIAYTSQALADEEH